MSSSPGAGVGIACIVLNLAYQQFENDVIYPRVMRRAVDVPAPMTVVAVLVGGALPGVTGRCSRYRSPRPRCW
jgi:predicted PurR-regulated permease PerM